MGTCAFFVCGLLMAAAPPTSSPAARSAASPPSSPTAPAASAEDTGEAAEEPEGGAGVSPVELIPRVELRQSYQRLTGGVSIHDTTAEIDIQFLKRVLLRYQVPFRRMDGPAAQLTGLGDVELGAIGVVASDRRYVAALIAGAVLDTASQPQLGTGEQQVFFGGGAAVKPRRWWLGYGVAQEQLSVAGDSARPDVNRLDVRLGSILFGKQYNWLKVDLDTTVDFPGGAAGRLFGTLEAGSLLIGRVGLYIRSGTQLLGSRQLDYSLAAGVRYLFRLERPTLR